MDVHRGVAVAVPVLVMVPGVAVVMEVVPVLVLMKASAAAGRPRGSAELFWPSANEALASTASC